jgi:phenylacetate-CoA ligase
MNGQQPYYDEHVETMPRADIERLQEVRLLRLIPYVYERSALVRDVWDKAGITPRDIRSLQDYKDKVPFIDKNTIQRYRDTHGDPAAGLCCVGSPHLRGIGFTSGTTGDATPVPRGEEMVSDLLLRRDYWQMGARPGDFMSLMQFTYRKGQHGGRFKDMGVVPICFEHHPRDLPRLFEASLKYRPTILHMISTPMVLGMERLINEGNYDPLDVFSSYRGMVFGGEPLGPRLKGLLESWGLEIFEYGTAGDIQGVMECRAHDGMHAWEDTGLLEFVEPGGTAAVAEGQRAELVVTALADDIAPLIRYRSEDLVSFTRERCSCGRTHARFRLLGRKGDEVVINGKSILPRDIVGPVEQVPESSAGLFQVIRTAREADVLRVRVGFDPALVTGSKAELIGRLSEHLSAQLQVPVEVELLENAELLKLGPPTKIPRVTTK